VCHYKRPVIDDYDARAPAFNATGAFEAKDARLMLHQRPQLVDQEHPRRRRGATWLHMSAMR
jgi:hypothetical protein